MASIEINSENVFQACEKAFSFWMSIVNAIDIEDSKENRNTITPGKTEYARKMAENILMIQRLAEFSEKFGLLTIEITHNDFALIGEYLIIPGKD